MAKEYPKLVSSGHPLIPVLPRGSVVCGPRWLPLCDHLLKKKSNVRCRSRICVKGEGGKRDFADIVQQSRSGGGKNLGLKMRFGGPRPTSDPHLNVHILALIIVSQLVESIMKMMTQCQANF